MKLCGCPRDVAKILTKCLEAMQGWMERNRLRVHHARWLCLLRLPRSGSISLSTASGAALPHSRLVIKFKHSQLLLKEQVEAVPKMASTQAHLCHRLWPFLAQQAFRQPLLPWSPHD